MPESIASRVARIIAGATQVLLEKAENLAPESVMTQSIRDIEQVASEVRVDLGKAEAAKHLLLTQMAKLNEEHARLDAQVETAIAQQRDDLASAAIGRQTDIEDYLPVLQKSLDEQTGRAMELEGHILALLGKKRELEQVLAEYQIHQEEQPFTHAASGWNDRRERAENAAAAFGRVLSHELGVSGLAAGHAKDAVKLKELVELQRTARIAERLAALKATKAT